MNINEPCGKNMWHFSGFIVNEMCKQKRNCEQKHHKDMDTRNDKKKKTYC